MVYTTHLWESWGWWILLLNIELSWPREKNTFMEGWTSPIHPMFLMTVHGLVHHPRTKMISTASRIWLRNVTYFQYLKIIEGSFSPIFHFVQYFSGWWFQTWFLLSTSYMGCHPNPIDELIFFKMVGIYHFPIYWNNHHPNWLHHFSEGWNHQPVFRICGLRGKNHGTDLRGHYLGVLSRRSTRAVAARARYRGALGWALGGTGGESIQIKQELESKVRVELTDPQENAW